MHLLLIRHGQTPCNVAGVLDTAFPGAGLTRLGTAQAAALPAALAGEPIVGVYASRLKRARLTAAPLVDALGLELRVRQGLEEISAGAWEGRSDESALQGYTECFAAWMEGELGRAVPEGPDGHAFLARFDAAIGSIADAHDGDDTVAVVSHGAAIRVYTACRTDLEPATMVELRMPNTGLVALDGHPDRGWQVSRWSSEPLGGAALADEAAHDVTGESVDEVLE